MRKVIALGSLLVTMAAAPVDAGVGRRCRRLCRPLIRCCTGAGYRPTGCRAAFVNVCKIVGLEACDPNFRCTPTTPGCDAISSGLYEVCGCFVATGKFNCN